MKIYLMRHGETEWNRVKRLQGQSDIPLNEYGLELAEQTARGLRDVDFDAVFSSPLVRAYATAQVMAGDRLIPVERDERLREISFGDWEGTYFDTAKQDPGHPLHNFFCKPGDYRPGGSAESFDQVRARAQSFFAERILPLERVCENVLVVAHGAFNRSFLNRLAGISDEDFWQIHLPNCAVSTLSLEQGEFKILDPGRVYYTAE